jgi:molecular chaperone DnaK
VVDLTLLGRAPLVLPLGDVQDACAGLVARTLEVVDEVLAASPGGTPRLDPAELAGFYVVGGGSSFPPVLRQLRERFGQRVKRSPHPFAATAIGLACFLDEEAGYELTDCLTRHFGVWREAAAGAEVSFDAIFPRDARLPGPKDPPLTVVRRYRPVHNVGHYRYVECGALREGRPEGGVTPWDGILFPFDPVLRELGDLSTVPVRRLETELPEVEERYQCGAAGTFEVTLTSLGDGYSRRYQIGRMAGRLGSLEADRAPGKPPASPRGRSPGRG